MAKKRKRKKMPKRYNVKTGRFENKETGIEAKMRIILKTSEIKFIQEREIPYLRSYKKYDFYCWENDEKGNKIWEFFLECHGDYYHHSSYMKSDNNKKPKANKMQRKNMRNDQVKINLAKKLNIPLIVFWEHTINNRPVHVRDILINRIQEFSVNEDRTFFYEDY